jgi:hypothetical protein
VGKTFKLANVWKCVIQKLAERRNLNRNIPAPKKPESGTELKFRPEFRRNLQPRLQRYLSSELDLDQTIETVYRGNS